MPCKHETRNQKTTDTWLTPLYIIKALGEFDLDPCVPNNMPWKTAKHCITEQQDGLKQPWKGRVWLNPPYGPGIAPWLRKMALHRQGITLMFARTETKVFHDYVWPIADSVFFFKGRIRFYDSEGSLAKGAAASPSVLIAYSKQDSIALKNSSLPGKFVNLN